MRSLTPSPWVALEARPEVMLAHQRIAEPGRYYDGLRTIVLRTGLLIEDQRRYLWHELVHADRRDESCHADLRSETSVEREAARRAMPILSLEWAFGIADNWHTAAALLKLPEEWVRWWVGTAMSPAGRELVRRASVGEVVNLDRRGVA